MRVSFRARSDSECVLVEYKADLENRVFIPYTTRILPVYYFFLQKIYTTKECFTRFTGGIFTTFITLPCWSTWQGGSCLQNGHFILLLWTSWTACQVELASSYHKVIRSRKNAIVVHIVKKVVPKVPCKFTRSDYVRRLHLPMHATLSSLQLIRFDSFFSTLSHLSLQFPLSSIVHNGPGHSLWKKSSRQSRDRPASRPTALKFKQGSSRSELQLIPRLLKETKTHLCANI